ncbi:AsmA family protein [Shewanella sp. NIFS-20-20]|uniref:AsmA family protein n=1 Tax=Shewanella sp. NIFS-20-20 TaxID=2853806 RepID=UPI001C4933A8|nr:AsmA family protein [Shewanella sp. NIFS-20-20]MBV7315067.1 AsmA family protein [Shewanella sp. NIFS-20-20]
MKLLKWFVIIVAIIILVPIIYLSFFFNINEYKGQLTAEVEKATGRQLTIADDLRWSFYPDLGIRLGGVTFANPKGLSTEPMLSMEAATVEVALMPLFSKSIQIAEIRVDGLTANLVTGKNGETSFSGLGDKSTPAKPATDTTDEPASNSLTLSSLEVGGISIANTKINLIDKATNTSQQFSLDKFTLGHFVPEVATPMSIEFSADTGDMQLTMTAAGQIWVNQAFSRVKVTELDVQSAMSGAGLPQGKVTTEVLANLDVDLTDKQLAVDLTNIKANNITGKGTVAVNFGQTVPRINTSLDFAAIDLTPWLPTSSDDKANNTTASASEAAATEPDLSVLKQINLQSSITIAGLTMDKFTTGPWKIDAAIKDGIAHLTSLTAQLYDGELKLSAQLDGRQPVASYSFSQSLKGVQVREMLTQLADIDFLSGNTAFNVTGTGRSLIPAKLKQNLNAKGGFELTNGSIYGVNIPQMIREAQAALKGDLQKDEAEKKTDFSSLAGTFTVANGVVNNPDLLLQSPLIRVSGQGDANIVTESLDYQLTTKVVGSLQGQGGSEQVSGVSIPLLISGSFSEPKFALDTKALLNNKVKDEVKKVEDNLKNKLLDKLGGF